MDNLADRISEALIWSRTDAGLSQEQMAELLGVSKKTIQNWESGVGCPRLDQAIQWFQKLGRQPIPYFIRLTRTEISEISHGSSDEEIRLALHSVVEELSPEDCRKMMYCALYNHGSSPSGLIDLLCAYLHTPLRDRLTIALIVRNNYALAKTMHKMVGEGNVQPNIDYLDRCISEATESAVLGRQEYNTTGGKNETAARDASKGKWID